MTNEQLIREAILARQKAHAPYSDFYVGAALLTTDGTVYGGCNIENSSYGGTVCAERVAFCKALSEGERDFSAIAIVGAVRGGELGTPCMPCGICRQFMSEFCQEDFKILTLQGDRVAISTLGELLPGAFYLNDHK